MQHSDDRFSCFERAEKAKTIIRGTEQEDFDTKIQVELARLKS